MTNHNHIESIPLAYEMAEAESPYRELSLHARKLGLTAVSEEMHQRAIEAGNTIGLESIEQADSPIESAPEARLEQLRSLLGHSGYVVQTWLNGEGVPVVYGGGKFSGYQTFHGENINTQNSEATLRIKSDPDTLGNLRKRGVAEVVSFTQLGNAEYGRLIPAHNNERSAPVTVFTYETTVSKGLNGPHYQQGNSQIPGIETRYHLFLVPSEAEQLRELIEKEPELVHTLTDTLLQDSLKVPAEQWKKYGPQYENWKELNGGVHRLAIRNHLNEAADKATIVEY